MINGRDFVVLSDDWDGLPTSAIHLFRRLQRRNRVFWFNTVGRLPRLSQGDAVKVCGAIRKWIFKGNGRQPVLPGNEHGNVHVASPVMVPWFKPLVRRFNRASLLRKYASHCDRYAIRKPIVITTFPHVADFVKAVPAALKVYYCVDDFLDYPRVNHADWAVMEAQLLRDIDALVITSKKLAEKRLTECPILHLPHGVDFEHFHEAAETAVPEPRMEGIRRPIVGFMGLLSPWVDLTNIAHLADAFPQCSFVLLGRSEVSLRPLAGRPNIHCLGWVPYAELPRYARYFDVGLISFIHNRMTKAINPLKLMEYFALGLPVLASRIPELEHMPGPLRLATSRDEFRAGLDEILTGLPGSYREDAQAVAQQNTWDARVEQLSGFLEELCAVPA
jgi:glycosyltransferase involved in cell wall biosynthesis